MLVAEAGAGVGWVGGVMCLEATVEKRTFQGLGPHRLFKVALVVRDTAVDAGDIEKPV